MNCSTCNGTGRLVRRYSATGDPVPVACHHCGGSGIVPPSPVHPPPLEPDPADAVSYCEWYASQVGIAAGLVKVMVPVRESILGVLTLQTFNGEECVGIRHVGAVSDDELARHLENLARVLRGEAPVD